MYHPLALYIGLRYTRAKRRNHFISFVSFVSTLGIALGIAVLITVLSVMNGFDTQIQKQVFSMVPEVTVNNMIGPLKHWDALLQRVKTFPGVLGVAPYIDGQALLSNGGAVLPAVVTGMDPLAQKEVSLLHQKMIAGSFDELTNTRFGIVLGKSLAMSLGVRLGDKVVVTTPQISVTPVGMTPRVKRFTVVGVFNAGDGLNMDSAYAFIHLKDAQILFQYENSITGLRLNIENVLLADQFSLKLSEYLQPGFAINTWTRQLGAYFNAIALEKNMMFIILMMIIAVAAFNLVSSLVMVVNEKAADIAILKTLGATPKTIMMIFIVQGAVVGLFALALGLILGIALTMHVNAIAQLIQTIFHIELISSSVYIVDYLPYEFESADIIKVCSIAFGMSVIATIYPALRAARTEPVEALRYE